MWGLFNTGEFTVKNAYDGHFRGMTSDITCMRCREGCEDLANTDVDDVAVMKSFLASWNPPTFDWVKLNVDGSMIPKLGSIFAGGVVRDHRKNWLIGFALNKGVGSVLEAELYGILEVLKLVWKNGFKKHVYRESIWQTDLRILAILLMWGLQYLKTPPTQVTVSLDEDFKGVTIARMVPNL
ncbi:hypothetical protein Ddye_010197 [Dipteronia dyeriana]|uniref:RNase H type-1 domain-containing protein n=1 Tax=Dipteronia dyeriana TaxID=168575 RepID=A0AAE0CMX6_9ROSI|nr:hypothetical protein Ddye_010197 [Dipteronia dyeriana]